jgi:retron-type reverse transcriptase
MKAFNHLFDSITAYDNLLLAFRKARRGKQSRGYVRWFFLEMERELESLEKELKDETYMPGSYREFYIHDPKTRKISAAPFRDRVVHHALCNIIEPLFERTFIFDSYANRKGKGTHRAVARCQEFSRQYAWFMKCDIRQYFPSIDHEILKTLLRRKIKDRQVLWLLDLIIDGSNPQDSMVEWFPGDSLFTPIERRRGLPIGNQTSQFFSNVYLSPLDHFVKENLRLKGYVRYVDDFLFFADEKRTLWEIKKRIIEFLYALRLRIHEEILRPAKVAQGIAFLGYRVFPDHRLLRKANALSFARRYRKKMEQCRAGEMPFYKLTESVQAWVAHAMHADTFGLRRKILQKTK